MCDSFKYFSTLDEILYYSEDHLELKRSLLGRARLSQHICKTA